MRPTGKASTTVRITGGREAVSVAVAGERRLDQQSLGIDLSAGEHVLRVTVEAGGANLNWLEFVYDDGSGGQYMSATRTITY